MARWNKKAGISSYTSIDLICTDYSVARLKKVNGSGHEGAAVLLPGFAIIW